MMRAILLIAMLAAAACGGCDALGYLGYLVAPDLSQKTVEAEFKGLEGKTVAVAVFADPSTQYEFPSVRYELGLVLADALEKNVKGLRVVAPARVVKYQDEHPGWEAKPKTELGKALAADYVLYVALVEFATRQPGSMHLYRGRIKAQAALYESQAPPQSAKVWSAERVEAVYPAESGVGVLAEDDRQILLATQQLFAQKLAQKFYKHKEAGK